MNASFKIALIFFFATAITATAEEELKKLKHRHPILAPLSDLSLSVSEAEHRIASMVNNYLSLPEQSGQSDMWKKILMREVEYPFEQDENGLNAELLLDKLTAEVETWLNNMATAPSNAMSNVFEEGLVKLEEKIRHLIKMELIQQLFWTVQGKQASIVFRGDVIIQALNVALGKLYKMNLKGALDGDVASQKVMQRLKALDRELEAAYLPQMRQMFDLLGNPSFVLAEEVKALNLIAQLESTPEQALHTLPLKFATAFELFTQASLALKQDSNVVGLFETLRGQYTDAVKSGSKIGTLVFKKLVPEMVGHAIRIIGMKISPKLAFEASRDFLRLITKVNNEVSKVVDFLNEYLAQGNLPRILLSSSNSYIGASIKIVDIVKRVPYEKIDKQWWSQTLPSLHLILKTVSADLINALEMSKTLVSNRISTFESNPEYFLGLYNLVVEAIVELGSEMAQEGQWVFSFLDFVQERYQLALSEPEEEQSQYILKYYLLIVINTLAFRTSDHGAFDFQEIKKELFAGSTVFEKLGSDANLKSKLFNFLANKVKTDKNLGITSVGNDLNFLLQLSGKSVPLSLFKKLDTENKLVTETAEGADYQNQRQGFKFQVTKADVKEIPRPATVVPPVEEKMTQPAVEEVPAPLSPKKEPIKEESPKKVQQDDGVNLDNKIELPETQDVKEEENPQAEETPATEETQATEEPQQLSPEERDNIVKVVKGSLDPELVRKLEKTPDMYDMVTRLQIEVDPETGDETHFYYVQLVETGTPCHDKITEALD